MKRLMSVVSNGDYPQPLQSTWGFSGEVVNSSTHIMGFKILGKKIFFSGTKITTKKYFLLQRICNEKSFYLWWVGGVNYFLYIFVLNKPMI